MKLYDVAGWAGVACVIAAYSLITFDFITSDQLVYGLLNICGALGIIWSSFTKRDFQPVALNVVWLTIAVAGIVTSAS